jgi:predicted DNA-binding transcriptional regulator AlpA
MSALRLPDVLERTGLSKTAIYRLIREGRFPRSIGSDTARALASRCGRLVG